MYVGHVGPMKSHKWPNRTTGSLPLSYWDLGLSTHQSPVSVAVCCCSLKRSGLSVKSAETVAPSLRRSAAPKSDGRKVLDTLMVHRTIRCARGTCRPTVTGPGE